MAFDEWNENTHTACLHNEGTMAEGFFVQNIGRSHLPTYRNKKNKSTLFNYFKTEITMKPTLVLLAAGMGSRYGGLKQLDGLGPNGETIMDYSIYDAIQSAS